MGLAQEAAVTVVKACLCWLAGASSTCWPGLGTSQRYNDTAQRTYVTAATRPVLSRLQFRLAGSELMGAFIRNISNLPRPNTSFLHTGTDSCGFKCSVGKKKKKRKKRSRNSNKNRGANTQRQYTNRKVGQRLNHTHCESVPLTSELGPRVALKGKRLISLLYLEL